MLSIMTCWIFLLQTNSKYTAALSILSASLLETDSLILYVSGESLSAYFLCFWGIFNNYFDFPGTYLTVNHDKGLEGLMTLYAG